MNVTYRIDKDILYIAIQGRIDATNASETEEKIFKIVSELIGSSEFGTTDDLYALGFTSLTLMKLNSLIYNETNVNIDITSLFNNPTVQSLAYKIDNNIESDIDVDEIIESAKNTEYFPLTSNQLGIYYECMQTEKIKYTMPFAIRFESSIDPNKLRDAVIKTVDAHPYLKTRIINTDDGKVLQKRCDHAEIEEIEIEEIAKKLGRHSSLTQYEEAYIEKWVFDFGYDMNIIEIALKRTTLKLKNVDF